jgi:hypothetical protein
MSELDRDTPGVFQLWESDLAEVRENPAAIHNVGGCEPQQLQDTIFRDYDNLGRALLVYYDAALYTSAEREVDGEIDDETLERGESDFANYLTFDLRSFLRQPSWLRHSLEKVTIGPIMWPFYQAQFSHAALRLIAFTRNSAGAPVLIVEHYSVEELLLWGQRAGSACADERWLRLQKGGTANG